MAQHYIQAVPALSSPLRALTSLSSLGENADMSTSPKDQALPDTATLSTIPDRACTWCKVTMLKRLVADGKFVHYTCPKCIFQHTSKRDMKKGSP